MWTRASARNAAFGLAHRIVLAPRLWNASSRSLPDFLIIGAPKSGTTSLFHLLGRHPQVMRSLYKVGHYFSLRYERGENWYRAHFPTEGETFGDLPSAISKICSHLGIPPWTPDREERRNVGSYPPMNPATRARLRELYAPSNQKLYKLLGRTFPWDHPGGGPPPTNADKRK